MKKTSFSLFDEEAFLHFSSKNPCLRLGALIYSMDVKDAWESLANHGRGIWDGAKACYTCEASTQSKGEGASNRRLLDGREGHLARLAWAAAMVLEHSKVL